MEKKTLKDIVYDSILESIYASEYQPDEILTESDLIQRFGYSKSPIREALTALCHEGVLRNIPRCGYQVIPMTFQDIYQILQYRLVLESGMIRVGLEHMDETFFKKLEDIIASDTQDTEDIRTHWIYNRDFHVALISAAKNPYACDQLYNTMMTLYRAYAQIHWPTTKEYFKLDDVKYHTKIIEALKDKDIETAIEYLRRDFEDFGKKV